MFPPLYIVTNFKAMSRSAIEKQIRIILLPLLLLIFTTANSQTQQTTVQWQEDLNFLQKKIHQDYSNLFYNVTEKQFDSAVSILRNNIPKLTSDEITVAFFRLTAMFKIGHTGIRFRAGESDAKLTAVFRYLPITFYQFSDGLYIRNIETKYAEAAGGKVIAIGNTPVAIVLEKIRTVIPSENEQFYKNNLQYYLRLPEILAALKISSNANSIAITYLKDGNEKTLVMPSEPYQVNFTHSEIDIPKDWIDAYPAYNTASSVLWMKEPTKIRHFEYFPETKTVYVRHSAVQDDAESSIRDYFEKVFHFIDSAEVDKFVLDIRLNGGGNNYLNKPVVTDIIQSKKINRYGHLFIITGAATFSAAQNLTNELEKYTEAVFVGEPTAENVNFYGDTKTEILPNSKMNLRLSWLWWQNSDPRDKRKWTAPLLSTPMSFQQYQNGIDPAMMAVQQFKDEQPIDEQLQDLIRNNKYAEASTAAKRFYDEPTHIYFKDQLEDKLNNIGYSLMGNNKFEEANHVLEINVRLYPGSANAYDSYAESLWKLGKKEDAIKNYEIAISKYPNDQAGENSRKMLKMIKDSK